MMMMSGSESCSDFAETQSGSTLWVSGHRYTRFIFLPKLLWVMNLAKFAKFSAKTSSPPYFRKRRKKNVHGQLHSAELTKSRKKIRSASSLWVCSSWVKRISSLSKLLWAKIVIEKKVPNSTDPLSTGRRSNGSGVSPTVGDRLLLS